MASLCPQGRTVLAHLAPMEGAMVEDFRRRSEGWRCAGVKRGTAERNVSRTGGTRKLSHKEGHGVCIVRTFVRDGEVGEQPDDVIEIGSVIEAYDPCLVRRARVGQWHKGYRHEQKTENERRIRPAVGTNTAMSQRHLLPQATRGRGAIIGLAGEPCQSVSGIDRGHDGYIRQARLK